MARLSVRAGKSRISGGPVFWLVAGPFLLVGYIAIAGFALASVLIALVVGIVKDYRRD